MYRIFLSLAVVSNLIVLAAFVMGFAIDDPRSRAESAQAMVSNHLLVSLGALMFCSLVHAIVLTYFMGTGRWFEETGNAYQLDEANWKRSKSMKYRCVLAMLAAFTLLLFAGVTGALSDPSSPASRDGWLGMSASTIHLCASVVAVIANIVANLYEGRSIHRNGQLIAEMLAQVRDIREERGLPV